MQPMMALEYHKIGSPPRGSNSSWYIPEDTFVSHLKCLRDSGWRVVNLDGFLAGLNVKDVLSERLVLLTFDDAYRNLRTIALPKLQEFGYPAVVFVPTNFIGGNNDFDRGREPEEDICTWEDLHALACSGVSVQSHGVAHPEYGKLSSSQVKDEIEQSKAILEGKLGEPVVAFAYPFGQTGKDYQATRAALIQAGYRAAFLYDGKCIKFPADVYCLNRLPLFPTTNLRTELAAHAP